MPGNVLCRRRRAPPRSQRKQHSRGIPCPQALPLGALPQSAPPTSAPGDGSLHRLRSACSFAAASGDRADPDPNRASPASNAHSLLLRNMLYTVQPSKTRMSMPPFRMIYIYIVSRPSATTPWLFPDTTPHRVRRCLRLSYDVLRLAATNSQRNM